jgi:hypothetical protein
MDLIILNPNPYGYKKRIAMLLGVTYDYQVTNGTLGEPPVGATPPHSQPAGIHKNANTYRVKPLNYEKLPKTTFKKKTFNKI